MDNSFNQEQDDSQVVDPTSKTLTEKSKSCSTQDLLDAYEMEFWYEEQKWKLN
jgi:hypothetical protein